MTHKELMAAMDKDIEFTKDLTSCAQSVRRQLKKRRRNNEPTGITISSSEAQAEV